MVSSVWIGMWLVCKEASICYEVQQSVFKWLVVLRLNVINKNSVINVLNLNIYLFFYSCLTGFMLTSTRYNHKSQICQLFFGWMMKIFGNHYLTYSSCRVYPLLALGPDASSLHELSSKQPCFSRLNQLALLSILNLRISQQRCSKRMTFNECMFRMQILHMINNYQKQENMYVSQSIFHISQLPKDGL